jgi:hypothetical protein
MQSGRFRDSELDARRAAATLETHRTHVFPHPIWDGGERIQLHVWEDPSDSAPDYFAEFNEPLAEGFRRGLGVVLARIAAEADAGTRQEAEQALLVELTGFWEERPRIEEGIMKRMLVVTSWRFTDPDGTQIRDGFPD